MPEFTATATISFVYDSRDSLVETAEQAREDVMSYLDSGPSPSEFTITVTEVDPEPLLSLVAGQGFIYTGPLEAAKRMVEEDFDIVVETPEDGPMYAVHLRDRTDPEQPSLTGYGDNVERAHRKALGLLFAGLNEGDLRLALGAE